MSKKELTFTQQIKASPKEVYFAFTTIPAVSSWLSDNADLNVQEDGGYLFLWWNGGYYAAGTFSKVEEDKQLTFSWKGSNDPGETQVDVTFKEKDGGTLVTLKHSGIGETKAWQKAAEEIKKGWEAGLVNLQWVVEKGVDKRIFDRPLMGVYIGGVLDKENAKRLGVPVEKGVWITNTVEDSGAEAAGLQGDDVIVKVGDTDIVNINSFAPVLADYKAEEMIDMTIYRGKEKKTYSVKLSRRPYPEVPDTVAELVEQAKKNFAEVHAELAELFKDASEEEAAKRPAPDEWSAKETLAHFIYSERWAHFNISSQVDGGRFPPYNNDLGTIAALASAYPTVKDMLEELKRSEVVTLGAIRNLSEEVVARKLMYYGFANGPLQASAQHYRNHYDQIKNAIAAAKEA